MRQKEGETKNQMTAAVNPGGTHFNTRYSFSVCNGFLPTKHK